MNQHKLVIIVVGLVKSTHQGDNEAVNYLRDLKDDLRLSKNSKKQRWHIHIHLVFIFILYLMVECSGKRTCSATDCFKSVEGNIRNGKR